MLDVTIVTASTSQQTLAASNSARKGLTIFNQSPSTLYVSTVNGFTKANAPFIIRPETEWTLPAAFTGALYGLWDVASGQAFVTGV
jgi:hypothetical protein